jgi:hypothetical protein
LAEVAAVVDLDQVTINSGLLVAEVAEVVLHGILLLD